MCRCFQIDARVFDCGHDFFREVYQQFQDAKATWIANSWFQCVGNCLFHIGCIWMGLPIDGCVIGNRDDEAALLEFLSYIFKIEFWSLSGTLGGFQMSHCWKKIGQCAFCRPPFVKHPLAETLKFLYGIFPCLRAIHVGSMENMKRSWIGFWKCRFCWTIQHDLSTRLESVIAWSSVWPRFCSWSQLHPASCTYG